MRESARTGVLQLLTNRTANGAWLANVDVSKLYFPDYQRAAIPPHVAKIAGGWDNEFARPLLTSLRDGRLNVFDGRQTSAAAIKLGKPSLLAFVWEGWSYERENKAFFIHNSVPRQVSGWKKFRADLKSGNQAHAIILETLASYGLSTPLDPGVNFAKNADITTPGPIQALFRRSQLPGLHLYCKIMKNWKVGGTIPETAKATDFTRGLRDFIRDNVQHSQEVVNVLKHIQPEQVRNIANGLASKGRIDAAQIRQAFAQIASRRLTLAA